MKTAGQARRQEFEENSNRENAAEIDATYAHIRAVIENAKTASVDAIRHQLVGLLPEVRPMPDDLRAQLLSQGWDHMIEHHDAMVKANWAKFGYLEETDG